MKNKLKKSVFLLSSLMMLTVGAGVVGGISESPVGVAEAAEVTADVSFANKANRTVFNTSQQVWVQNGITVTNDKGSSTSNVADYANPARFYKSSKLTIEAPGNITSIAFTANSTTYATALKNSIKQTEGTQTTSGSVVTVTPATTANTFVISSLSGGQVRMNSLSVSYQEGEAVTYDYYVTFYNEAGDELKSYGTNGEAVAPYADQVKTGYNFVGWGLKDSTTPYDFTAEITGDVELYPIFEEVESSTIAEVLEDAQTGVNYKITGEIYAKTAYNGYYIQDETGAINLFGFSGSVEVGNTVTVFGSYSSYKNLPELTSVELIEVVSDDTTIETVPTSVISTENVGKYIELSGITLDSSLSSTVTTATNATATDGENSYTLRYISEFLKSDSDLNNFVSGSVVNVRGALSIFDTKLQILPTYIEFASLGQLETPSISFDEENKLISWTSVEGATSYTLCVLDNEENEVVNTTLSSTSYDVSEFANGSYTVSVIAKGNASYEPSEEGYLEFTLALSASEQVEVIETKTSFGFGYTETTVGEGTLGTSSLVAKDLGIANGIAIDPQEIEGVTYTFDKGTNTNATKYYNSGEALRAYGGNTITISADVNIKSVVFTFGTSDGSNAITADVGTFDTNTWSGDADSITFTIGGSTGNRRIAAIEVTYGEEATTTYEFSDLRMRFAATISAEVYESLNITGAGFVVEVEGYSKTMEFDCTGKFTTDENGDYYILASLWQIPEEEYDTVITAKAFIEVDGTRYFATETSYSVNSIVDEYLSGDYLDADTKVLVQAFKDQELAA